MPNFEKQNAQDKDHKIKLMSDESKTSVLKKSPFNGSLMGMIFVAVQVFLFTGTLYVKEGYVAKGDFEKFKQDQLDRRDQNSKDLHQIALDMQKIRDAMEADAKVREIEKQYQQRGSKP